MWFKNLVTKQIKDIGYLVTKQQQNIATDAKE